MFIAELFSEDAWHSTMIEDVVDLPELDNVPEKAHDILARLARFHQVKDLSFDRDTHKWIATNSAGITPFMRDAKHITSAAGMGTATMSEESMNEGVLSAAEARRNPGVEEGSYVSIKAPGFEHMLKYGKLLRWGRSGLAMIELNAPLTHDEEVPDFFKGARKISVPPSWVFASEQDAWPAPKWDKKPKQSALEGKGYTIDQDDRDEFSPEDCERIKNAHFPDTLRSNLRLKQQQDKERAQRATWSKNDGGSSSIGSPMGGSTSSNDY